MYKDGPILLQNSVERRSCAQGSRNSCKPVSRKRKRLRTGSNYDGTMVATLRTEAIPREIRGRTFRHWTPRYIRARTRQVLLQRRNPDAPWLTSESVHLLDSMLQPTDIGAEFGSGRSTLWLAQRCAHLISVEHDQVWHEKVLSALALERITHVDYQCHPLDESEAHGERSAYAQVAQCLPPESMDFALVDGVYRDYVTLFLLPKIRIGGMLIIDNVNRYLPSSTMSPGSLPLSATPATAAWEGAAVVLSGWRRIWTTDGVSDTAIFIRPASAQQPR